MVLALFLTNNETICFMVNFTRKTSYFYRFHGKIHRLDVCLDKESRAKRGFLSPYNGFMQFSVNYWRNNAKMFWLFWLAIDKAWIPNCC